MIVCPRVSMTCAMLIVSISGSSQAEAERVKPMPFQHSAQQLEWRQGRMGAGGFVTGIDIHPSGHPKLVRTDVGGAYKWDPGINEWLQVVTTYRLPEGALEFFEYDGVSSLVVAPSDPNRLYLAFSGKLYYSHDQGESWQLSEVPGHTKIHMEPNARVGRNHGERLAVDPANPDVVFFASNKDGLWLTLDGGRNWRQVPTDRVPVGEGAGVTQAHAGHSFPGVGHVHFDPSSPVVEGRTSRLLVTVWGVGLFESLDGGRSWAQVGDTMPAIQTASIANDGTYFFAQAAREMNAFLYKDGELRELHLRGRRRWSEAVIHPENSDILFLFGPGNMRAQINLRSIDGGETWETFSHEHLVADDIPWLAKESWFTTGAIVWDPLVDGRLWIAQGVGVWYADNVMEGNELTWHSRSAGIEELVVNDIVVPASGQPLIANWDRPLMKMEAVDVYPETWGPTPEFGSAWDLALMASNPQFVVGVIQGQANNPHAGAALSGWSEDGGRTWIPFKFESFPFNVDDPHEWVYGNIMVSSQDPDKLIWYTIGNRGRFLYSHDRGANWHDAEFSDGVAGNTWNRAYYFYKKALAADPNDGDVFYAYNWTKRQLYRSTDSGQTFDVVGPVPGHGNFHCKLRHHPKRSGHLFFTPGFNNHRLRPDGMQPLYETRDGGETWAVVEPSLKIIDIAFGAPTPGSTTPTYYVNGQMRGPDGPEWGIFWSLDEGQTWERIADLYPMGVSKGMSNLAADPDIFGRIYIGTSGIGFFYTVEP